MKRVVNPLVVRLLRSPLHRLLPGVMLITVTGRHTGRRYTTPVQYVFDQDAVYVLTRDDRSWWRNARGGATVSLRMRGRRFRGNAESYLVGSDGAAPALAAFRGSSLERGLARHGDHAMIVAITLQRPPS